MNSLWPQIPHVDRFFSGSPLTALLKADAAPVLYDYATALIRITVVNKSLVTDLKMRCIRSLNEELFQGRHSKLTFRYHKSKEILWDCSQPWLNESLSFKRKLQLSSHKELTSRHLTLVSQALPLKAVILVPPKSWAISQWPQWTALY